MKKALLLSFEFQVALYEINQFGILKNYIKSELNNFYLNVFGFFFFFLSRHVEGRPFCSLAVALEDPINKPVFHAQNTLFDSCTHSISSYLNVLSYILIAPKRNFQLGTNDFNKHVQHLVIF